MRIDMRDRRRSIELSLPASGLEGLSDVHGISDTRLRNAMTLLKEIYVVGNNLT